MNTYTAQDEINFMAKLNERQLGNTLAKHIGLVIGGARVFDPEVDAAEVNRAARLMFDRMTPEQKAVAMQAAGTVKSLHRDIARFNATNSAKVQVEEELVAAALERMRARGMVA